MPLAALIFDFDGTLVDTTSAHARAWERALQEFGYHVPAERIRQEIGKGGDRLVPTLLGQTAERVHGEALRDAHGDCYLQLIEEEGVRAFPHVRELIEAVRARGLKLALATAAKPASLKATLEQAGLADLLDTFDAIVDDGDVAHTKPHPDAVRPAVEKLGLPATRCAFVGDTAYDVEACKKAGLVCLALTSGPHDEARLRRAGARAVYADAADLLDHLDDALEQAAPGPEALTEERLETLMEAALEEARAGRERGEVPIGAILARTDGTILARGHNAARHLSTPVAHAEMEVLYQSFEARAEADDLVLVTTLEPCVMCLGAAMTARVDTIVYALPAPPNGGIDRCTPIDGARWPRFVGGVGAEASRALLAEWLAEHPESTFVRRLLSQLDEAAVTEG